MKKTKHGKLNKKTIIGIVIIIGVALALIFALYLLNGDTGVQVTNTKRGILTQKYVSCGDEHLKSDGSYVVGAGACDGGSSIKMGDERISTGGGALRGKREKVSDISNIHPGDIIEVKYVKQNGHASTNCATCYVKLVSANSRYAGFAE